MIHHNDTPQHQHAPINVMERNDFQENMQRTAKITGLSLLVLGQVALFALVYLATIGVGLGLVYLALRASMWFVPWFIWHLVPGLLEAGLLGLGLIVPFGMLFIGLFIGLWVFVGFIVAYIVKPLFRALQKRTDPGLEIKRDDSPKLYDLIMETAKEVGVREPRHIYVSHEATAYVFFDGGFWNLFPPARKNLVVGLGLFESMNAEEVKGVIAHEVGHFAQGSMRVDPVLRRVNDVINALVYGEEGAYGRKVGWRLRNEGLWGKATQWIVMNVRRGCEHMFRSQQRTHMKLSRLMEYDADAVACRIVGTGTFISTLCKTQQLSQSFGFYNEILNLFASRDKTVEDYWKGYELARPIMDARGYHSSSFDTIERNPESESVGSRVSIEETCDSLPSLEDRIKQSQAVGGPEGDSRPTVPAWELVTGELKTRVGNIPLQQVKRYRKGISIMDWSEYSERLANDLEMSFFPKEAEVLLDRQIILDSESDVDTTAADSHPLTDANRALVTEYEQALRDRQLLSMVIGGKTTAKSITYNGIGYSPANVPSGEQDRYVDGLKAKAARIDASIRRLAESKVEDTSLIAAAYEAIGYAQSIHSAIHSEFLPALEEILEELKETKIVGQEELDTVNRRIHSHETALKELIENLRQPRLLSIMTQDEDKQTMAYLDAPRSFIRGHESYSDDGVFTVLLAIIACILRIQDRLARKAKTYVAAVVLDQEIPDVKFLEFWSRTNEETPEKAESAWSDGREHVILESEYGNLDLVVPTDEELETIGHREHFRRLLWKKVGELEKGQPFHYPMVATMPLKEENGWFSCVNREDEVRFLVELNEYYRFLENWFQGPDWSKVSEDADNGNARACGRIAGLYLKRWRRNMAFGAAMKAALGGEASGLVTLGMLEATGEEKHPERAVQLFKCAAAQGNVDGLYNLAVRYETGEGIERNEAKAIRFFERAALQGNTVAQNRVGQMYLTGYETGDGVQRDEAKALRFFERAALQGCPEAQHRVGLMYLTGKGTPADPEKGLAWLRSAAKHGHHEAINTIWKYHKSAGDRPRYIEALQWGAREGLPECKRELEVLMDCHIFSDPGE